MINGTTSSGFAFSLEDGALDDMELLDALVDLQENDTAALSRVCRLLLGDEQRKALYDTLRTDSGRVPATAVMAAINEIFQSIQAGKN
ncbi:MAG: hypothetical protein LIO45_00875 [Clostridiales bacterium]|nr:hypothetical protein [Clostridiales bacterium]